MNSKMLSLSSETIQHYKKCFADNDSPKDSQVLNWQFFENDNKNFVDIEYDVEKQKTAAIYATFSVKFKIDNLITLGCQSLDTITDVEYRGKGLFIKLAKDVYQNATNNKIALVYGFPNGNSIHGFEKKLEWKVLDPVPFLIKPLKTKYFTDKIKALRFIPNINLSFSKFKINKNYILKEEILFPIEANIIWAQFSKQIKVAVVRDQTYLNWRYIQKPNEDYKIVHCYSKENQYLGVVVYTVKEKHNGKVAYIMELMYDLKFPKVGDILLSYAINKIKEQKADFILSWCMAHSPNYKAYKKKFFMSMPDKLRPIELHFGARAFREELQSIIEKRDNWYLSYSDSDTV